MLNKDTPAGGSGGSSPTPDQDQQAAGTADPEGAGNGSGDPGSFELPAKLRVHALAKLLGASSREVITTLNSLGASVRSAQSNITRDVALAVVRELRPEQLEVSAAEEPIAGQPTAGVSEGADVESNQPVSATNGQPVAEGSGPASPVEASPVEESPVTENSEVAASGAGQQEADAPVTGALAPVFEPPQAMFLAPEPAAAKPTAAKSGPAQSGQSKPGQRPAGGFATSEGADPAEESDEEPATAVATERAPGTKDTGEDTDAEADTDEDLDAGQDGDSGRRRRRRGRRGRGRGRGGDGESTDGTDQQVGDVGDSPDKSGSEKNGQDKNSSEKNGSDKNGKTAKAESNGGKQSESQAKSGDSDDETTEATKRRRRRRRRKGTGDDEGQSREDDPPNTVVHVRETQEGGRQDTSSDDEVRAIKGSTRLEAKRQRRRDGREAGRRRAPVLSESEFLARRESVDRRMVVRESGDQTQIAVLEDEVLVENFVTSSGSGSLVGNVYLGRVQNVLPSMEAAFVDIGRGRNAVLYAGEVDWDAAGLAGKARRIEQALSTGDSVLVQVTKDPVGHKGARLTTQVSLPGRFLVYVPGGGATGISRKLPDNERKRLKEILRRIVPDNAGVIIRTASEGTSEEALDRDVRRLQAQWEIIKERSEIPKAQAPQLLYEEPDLLIKVVRDLFTEDFSGLTVQGDNAWETIEAYVQHVAPDLMSRLRKHSGKSDVFTEQRITEQIAKALDRKVWLPSGGYLVVDRTEAMTVIDVNTGKYTGSGGNLEETVTRNNLEAAEEIVRQLRLRDIGGIIVIDFIDMVLESNRDLVLRRLTECLGRDRTRHQVAEVTSLGLVQMTRKRVGTGLLEAYSSTCEHCRGRGVMVSSEPVVHSHQEQGGNGGSRRKRGNKNQDDSGSDDSGRSDKRSDGKQNGKEESTSDKSSDKGSDRSSDKGPDKGSDKSRDKSQGDRKSGSKEESPKPSASESKPAESKPAEQKQPAATRTAEKSTADKSAAGESTVDDQNQVTTPKEKPASQPEQHPDAASAAQEPAKQEPAKQEPAAAQPAQPTQPAQAAAQAVPEPAPAEPASGREVAASEPAGRAKRRKVGRPTISTGTSPAAVVVTPEEASASEAVPEPERTVAPPRKPRRRAVSRPAGASPTEDDPASGGD